MAKWTFYAHDNSGKRQAITITAQDKTEAIRKGFEAARKKAKGEINNWTCHMIHA